MSRTLWVNPASPNYQARRWAQRAQAEREARELAGRSTAPSTPDPTAQTDSVRVDPDVEGVAFVVTDIAQPSPSVFLRLYQSSLVRADPVESGVAWLTITQYGP